MKFSVSYFKFIFSILLIKIKERIGQTIGLEVLGLTGHSLSYFIASYKEINLLCMVMKKKLHDMTIIYVLVIQYVCLLYKI
jgi:hypothetical protein